MEKRHGSHVAIPHDFEGHSFVAVHLGASKGSGAEPPGVDSGNTCIPQNALDVLEVTVCRDVNPGGINH